MNWISRCLIPVAGAAVAALSIWFFSEVTVLAQSGKSKTKSKSTASTSEVRDLDNRLEKVQGTFLKETSSIIKGYEDAGQFDRAKLLLEVLLKLDPKNDSIKHEIEQLDKAMLETTKLDIELDSAKTWQSVGTVTKDKQFRIEVDGDYRFQISNLTLGPEGAPTKDPESDLAPGIPLGAVIGVIIPITTDQGKEQKPPAPFLVGNKFEQTAKTDGTVLLKINAPSAAKCSGKLKVRTNGLTK